jgi:formylglycine-generating enzyme required for sulfatase activity
MLDPTGFGGGYLANLASDLTLGVLGVLSKKVSEAIKGTPREQALRRCYQAGSAALLPEDDPLQKIYLPRFQEFFAQPANQVELAELVKGREPNLTRLAEAFTETVEGQNLPPFPFSARLAAFVEAFLQVAEQEPELAETIQTAQLRTATKSLLAMATDLQAIRRAVELAGASRAGPTLRTEIQTNTLVVGPQVNFTLPPALPNPIAQLPLYLETVRDMCRQLPLGPLDPGGRESARITLEQVYVSLDAQPPLLVKFENQKAVARSALAYVAAYPRLVILGDPGAGKSTFLRFLALRLTQAALEPEADWLTHLAWPAYPAETGRNTLGQNREEALGQMPWPHRPWVPLLVTLRDFAATDFDPASPLALWKFISKDLEQRGLGGAIEAVRQTLEKGRGLLLLDGVDETPSTRRGQVWQAIGALSGGVFNRCRWVATCRQLSFVAEEAAGAKATSRLTLAPLNLAQIEAFITAWYQALAGLGEKTPAQCHSLATELHRAAAAELNELAPNPMLLTIMALVQTYYGTLPSERAKLYQACVETLLLRWQKSKEDSPGLPQSLAELGLKQEIIEPLLWEIGYTAHKEQATRQEAADIPEEQVMKLAQKHLGDWAKAATFVEYTERRAHLLVGLGGRDDRRFSFPHRTFQEYLAGCWLANDRRFGLNAIPLAEAGAPWREVLLLAAGNLVFNQKVARNLFDALKELLPPHQPAPGDTAAWQRTWRAGEMLAVAGPSVAEADLDVGAKLFPRLRTYLAALLSGGELTPPERAEAGRTLARLGDPRPGVVTLPPAVSDWLAGEYLYGEEKKSRKIKERFKAGLYPITNAQFRPFIAEGGYQEKHYWSQAGWQWLQENGYEQPRYWDEPAYNLDNHPVVGVSLYEAEAYCRWLTAKYGEQEGWKYRLPSEEEWERLARHTDGRKYPWGNQWQEGLANTAESGINSPCAVGLFPGGKNRETGVYDCAGNVWEWCFDVSYSDIVVRGGSWNHDREYARCAYRHRDYPDNRDFDYGFRIVVSPISPTSAL